jgi:hypothetical protein
LHAEENAFDIAIEYPVEVFLRNCPQSCEFPPAGIGEKNIAVPPPLLNRRVQPIKILFLRNIAPDTGNDHVSVALE